MAVVLRRPSRVVTEDDFPPTLFFCIPWWFVYYSWRQNRPRRSWTRHRTILVQIHRQILKLPMKFGSVDGRNLPSGVPQEEPEPLNAKFVWVPELREDLEGIVAERAARVGAKSVAIPADWILKEGSRWSPEHDKAQKDEKVMLYFHGGVFVAGSSYLTHPTAALAKGLLKYSTSLSRALSVDYRVSSEPPLGPENPFPCAIIDGIAAYKYLVCEMGFLPQNITVGGDSAGGNIALAVTRYIVESRLPHLPPPGGLIPASPVVDFSFSRADANSSHHLNAMSDIFDISPDTHPLSVGKPNFGVYNGDMDHEERKHNRYISPASKFATPPNVDGSGKLFYGFPRSYIIGGGAEHMFDDVVALAEKMKKDGVDVTTDFPPNAVHAYFIFGWHEPERTETLVKCAAWVDERPAATVAIELTYGSEGILV